MFSAVSYMEGGKEESVELYVIASFTLQILKFHEKDFLKWKA